MRSLFREIFRLEQDAATLGVMAQEYLEIGCPGTVRMCLGGRKRRLKELRGLLKQVDNIMDEVANGQSS